MVKGMTPLGVPFGSAVMYIGGGILAGIVGAYAFSQIKAIEFAGVPAIQNPAVAKAAAVAAEAMSIPAKDILYNTIPTPTYLELEKVEPIRFTNINFRGSFDYCYPGQTTHW